MRTPRGDGTMTGVGIDDDGNAFEVSFSLVATTDVDSAMTLVDEATMVSPGLECQTNPILAYAAEGIDFYVSDRVSSYASWPAERRALLAPIPGRLAAATADSPEIDLALVDWLHAYVLADAVNVEAARKRKSAPHRILDPRWGRSCVRPLSEWKKGLERASYARAGVSAARAAAHAARDTEERQYQVMVAFDIAVTSLDSHCPKQADFVALLGGLIDEHGRVSAA